MSCDGVRRRGQVREMTTRIIGTGSYVPEQIVTNDNLAQIVETNDEWIRSRTGIAERRLAIEETTSDMAAKAAKKALEQSGVAPQDIDLIFVATSSADDCFPSTACQVQAEVGAVNAACYDISAACTGFVFALDTAHAFISAGIYRTALIVGADVLSKVVDWTDRGTCVLFGDAAGAAVVRADSTGIIGLNMHSNGEKGHVLSCTARTNGNFLTGKTPQLGFTTMDGQEVFKFAVKKVPECVEQLLADTGISQEEIKYFVIHQANYRIIESIAKRLKVDLNRFPTNMERYGNTSAASIPLLLDELNRSGELKSGDKLIISGFGAGLTWGATLLEW